jgi:hypothetical protein
MPHTPEPRSEFRIGQGLSCAIVLFACLILISRRPDAILHAQFYAEDGRVWFADAYNLGWWHAFFRAQDGYFQTFPRLAAALALAAPLALAPLVLNLMALVMQALPIYLLVAPGSAGWGSLRFRAALAAIYLALPNDSEMMLIVTSSQWILALCAFLVITASVPRRKIGLLAEVLLLLLCGLTGPFCFFLWVVAIWPAWRWRERWRWIRCGILAVCGVVQGWSLLVLDSGSRSHAALGASPALFVRILAGQIYFGFLIGANGLAGNASREAFIIFACVAVCGTAFIAVCFVRGNAEMRLLLVLTALLLAASLVSPVAYPPPGITRWELLSRVPGIRYWFFPTLAFAWCVVSGIRSRGEILRPISSILLCLMLIGIVRDWRSPGLQDLHYAEFAKRFEGAPPGTVMIIPENPAGWELRLVKRADH